MGKIAILRWGKEVSRADQFPFTLEKPGEGGKDGERKVVVLLILFSACMVSGGI